MVCQSLPRVLAALSCYSSPPSCRHLRDQLIKQAFIESWQRQHGNFRLQGDSHCICRLKHTHIPSPRPLKIDPGCSFALAPQGMLKEKRRKEGRKEVSFTLLLFESHSRGIQLWRVTGWLDFLIVFLICGSPNCSRFLPCGTWPAWLEIKYLPALQNPEEGTSGLLLPVTLRTQRDQCRYLNLFDHAPWWRLKGKNTTVV